MTDKPVLNEAVVNEVAQQMESEQFGKALTAYAQMLPDPTEFLKKYGIQLPADAEMVIRLHGASYMGLDKTQKVKERVCWEVCVGPSWARVCREKCVWK